MTNRTKEMREGADLPTFDGSKRVVEGNARGGGEVVVSGGFLKRSRFECIYQNAPVLFASVPARLEFTRVSDFSRFYLF